MPLTAHDLAVSFVYDLWSDADHLAKTASIVRHELEAHHYDEALSAIERALVPAGLVEFRLRDCQRTVLAARDERALRAERE